MNSMLEITELCNCNLERQTANQYFHSLTIRHYWRTISILSTRITIRLRFPLSFNYGPNDSDLSITHEREHEGEIFLLYCYEASRPALSPTPWYLIHEIVFEYVMTRTLFCPIMIEQLRYILLSWSNFRLNSRPSSFAEIKFCYAEEVRPYYFPNFI